MGCILYEMAAGVKPFINDAAVTLFWIGHNPRFNASLDHMKYDINTKDQISKSVLKMLDIDPKVRPNASELSLAFAGYLGIDDASSHLLRNRYLGSEGSAEQVELATTSPISILPSLLGVMFRGFKFCQRREFHCYRRRVGYPIVNSTSCKRRDHERGAASST